MSEQDNERDEPLVIYVERDRGFGASWRRTKQTVQEAGRKWVSSSVDAELPLPVAEALPEWLQGKAGRTRLAVLAFLVLLAWIAALVWLIS